MDFKVGIFNFGLKFLEEVVKLDFGFKMYIVYGICEEFGLGDLVIKLYCDMLDVVFFFKRVYLFLCVVFVVSVGCSF